MGLVVGLTPCARRTEDTRAFGKNSEKVATTETTENVYKVCWFTTFFKPEFTL